MDHSAATLEEEINRDVFLFGTSEASDLANDAAENLRDQMFSKDTINSLSAAVDGVLVSWRRVKERLELIRK